MIDSRLDAYSLIRIDDLSVDSGLATRINKCGLIAKIVIGKSYEQSSGVLNTMTGDFTEYHVLLYTLSGRLRVSDGISGSAM